MPVLIQSVEPRSHAARKGLCPGDTLVSVNGNSVDDVLDYRFHITNPVLALELVRAGKAYHIRIEKEEYEDIGLEFETYLMDQQHACKNKCIFCFIDQMPQGMRETLYFKDDDSRMSFLFGNYITLTNLTDMDIERIIKMHISPVNVSVHTTDPALRVEMMKNPNAAGSLRFLERLVQAGIKVNTQLVLCPGWNDGEALTRSLEDLGALWPNLQSVACVPVGLTRHRDGLEQLRCFTPEESADTIARIHRFADGMQEQHGERVAYPSDEFFLNAGIPIPEAAYYGEFNQLENGVGMTALLKDEFMAAFDADDETDVHFDGTLVTGVLAAPLMRELAGMVTARFSDVHLRVCTIRNLFFGETITVAGLVTGQDIAAQLADRELGDRVLMPATMLRHERDRFLDDMTIDALEATLGRPVQPVENDGWQLYDAMTGR